MEDPGPGDTETTDIRMVRCVFCPRHMEEKQLSSHLQEFHRIDFFVKPQTSADSGTQTDGWWAINNDYNNKGIDNIDGRMTEMQSSAVCPVINHHKDKQFKLHSRPFLPVHFSVESQTQHILPKIESEAEPEEEHGDVCLENNEECLGEYEEQYEEDKTFFSNPVTPRIAATERQKTRRARSRKNRENSNTSSCSSMMYSFVEDGMDSIIDTDIGGYIERKRIETANRNVPMIKYSRLSTNKISKPTRISSREVDNLKDHLTRFFSLSSSIPKQREAKIQRRPLEEHKRQRKNKVNFKLEKLSTKNCNKRSFGGEFKNRKISPNNVSSSLPKELLSLQDTLSRFYSPASSSRRVIGRRRVKPLVMKTLAMSKPRVSLKNVFEEKSVEEEEKRSFSNGEIVSSGCSVDQNRWSKGFYRVVMDAAEWMEDRDNISRGCRNKNIDLQKYKYSDIMNRKLRCKLRAEMNTDVSVNTNIQIKSEVNKSSKNMNEGRVLHGKIDFTKKNYVKQEFHFPGYKCRKKYNSSQEVQQEGEEDSLEEVKILEVVCREGRSDDFAVDTLEEHQIRKETPPLDNPQGTKEPRVSNKRESITADLVLSGDIELSSAGENKTDKKKRISMVKRRKEEEIDLEEGQEMIHTDIIGDWGFKEEEIFPQNSVSGIGQCNSNIKNTSTSSKDSLKGIQISHVKSLAVEQFSKNTNTLHPVLPLEMNLDPYSFLSSPGSSKSTGSPRNPATYSASVGLGCCSVGSGSILKSEERRMRLTRIVRSLEEEGTADFSAL